MSTERPSLPLQTEWELEAALLRTAETLHFVRPLVPYPSWRFDADWENQDLAFRLRRQIWSYFRDREREAPLVAPTYDGQRLELHLGNDLSKQLFVGGCHEPNESAFLAGILRPGMVFIDAGANEGFFSVLAASRLGPSGAVLAFEPSEREFRRLKRNLEINGLTNVTAWRAALSDRTGQAELLVANGEHSGQNTLGAFVHTDVALLHREIVESRTLDDVVREAGLCRVDVIKIDVEGAEASVLAGSARILREMRPVVIFELLEEALARQGSSFNGLRGIFATAGYSLYGFHAVTGRLALLDQTPTEGNLVAVPSEVRLPEDLYAIADLPVRGDASHADASGDLSVTRVSSGIGEYSKPYLSIVATSRNDDHGGSLTRRMQTFVNSLLGQCRRHSIEAELILVEWNPPSDRPPLAEALQWPRDTGPCRVRIVEVPPRIHDLYEHAANLPLYQMIGKNAGIRRARGRFVLATNIDILFNDELMRFIAAGGLHSDRMYRIDRYDAMSDVPVDGAVDEQLEYCRTHILRVNAREGTFPLTLDGRLPESPSAAPALGPAAVAGITFGSGWYPAEQHSGEIFRWANIDPEIIFPPESDRRRILLLEIEPGPSVGRGPLVLEVSDSLGGVLGTATISGRAWLCVAPPLDLRAEWLRFRVVGGALPVTNDYRILNFRLFRHEWAGRPESTPAGVFVRGIPFRKRLSHERTRASRLVRGLGARGGPARFGVPFSAPLVRALGLKIDASGMSLNFRAESLPPALPATAAEGVPERPSVEKARPILLHTNACGDFTLMARERWLDLRGYPEFDVYSFNIDAIFCMAAHYGGVAEEMLSDPMRIYHIEHGLGSGWTPEGQTRLFERLAAKGIPYIDWPEVEAWCGQMHRLRRPIIFNGERWGLAGEDLRETIVVSKR